MQVVTNPHRPRNWLNNFSLIGTHTLAQPLWSCFPCCLATADDFRGPLVWGFSKHTFYLFNNNQIRCPNTPQRKPASFLFSSLSRLVAAVRVSPCHSRQPSIISDASALEGDRSSTPSDINSPRHRTHSLCNVRAAHLCTLPSNPPPFVEPATCPAAWPLLFLSTVILAELVFFAPHSLTLQLWRGFMCKPVVE